jgi:AAA15 family ATPase/GTPase
MLVEFKLGNYRSFCEDALFSMVASNYKEHRGDNVFVAGPKDLPLLTTCVCYGANASGKSNLLKAFSFMKGLVQDSSRESRFHSAIDAVPFAFDADSRDRPSFMEVSFIIEEVLYRYGFEVASCRVLREWLYESRSSRESMLFEREGSQISLGSRFRKEGRGLAEKTRENALFLSVVANFNGPRAVKIARWFGDVNVIDGLGGGRCSEATVKALEKDRGRLRAFLRYLRVADLGISGFSFETREGDGKGLSLKDHPEGQEMPSKTPKVVTSHKLYDENQKEIGETALDLFLDESAGTQRFFCLLGPIQEALTTGKVLFIDELDASFHGMMARFLISLFHSPEANPGHAQLVFTTHNTNLLDSNLFRRDQVWFTEKDRFGKSALFSLADFKPRTDERLEKNYLAGRYGAIPNIREYLLSKDKDEELNER